MDSRTIPACPAKGRRLRRGKKAPELACFCFLRILRPFAGQILLAALLTFAGCSDQPSAPAPLSSKEKEILAIARRTLEELEDWGALAEYKIKRVNGRWEVVAWKIVHPEAKGNLRYVPWGKTTMRIEDNGHVTDYRKGK